MTTTATPDPEGNVMRRKMLAAALLAATAGGVIATPAHATTVSECQLLIQSLEADTDEGGLFKLADKAGAAVSKLDQGKIDDALQKLHDYHATLEALRSAPKVKVDPDLAASLDAEVDSAIACVAGISPS
jgi:hypothetical protein